MKKANKLAKFMTAFATLINLAIANMAFNNGDFGWAVFHCFLSLWMIKLYVEHRND